MSSKFRFISILTLAIAVFSTAVMAQEDKTKAPVTGDTATEAGKCGMGKHKMGKPGFGGKFGRHRAGMFRMIEGLNLTEEQKQQIKAIREANKPDMALMEELRAIHEARKAGTDLTAEQKARINVIRDQMRTHRQSVHDQIQNIFTAEQKALIEQQKQQMKLRREQFKQNRELRHKQKVDATTTEKPAV
ncbi:MAG: Spy/CpxP family protein refolding chaperone [Chloracidobacterium sp.]|nr:Spy/CpxP family protein refolding chaperone [Chloracidobacterium sp.]